MTTTLNHMMLGAIATGSFVVGLIFMRYWRSTRDRFFLMFALSFWIEAANRVHMGLTNSWNEDAPLNYSIRLLAYAVILVAIWDKNRPGAK